MSQFDVYKYDMTFLVGGHQATSAWYYRQADDDSASGLTIAPELSAALETQLFDNYLKPLLSDQVALIATRCQKWALTKDTPFIKSEFQGFGTDIGDPLANQSAVIITKYPGTWSRNFIGRNFIPGVPENHFDANRIFLAFRDTFQTSADSAELNTVSISTPESLDFDQVILSAKRFKEFDPETQTIEDIYSLVNTVVVQSVLGTQRSRRPPRSSGPA